MNKKDVIPNRLTLSQDRFPRYWYNITADMPVLPSPVKIGEREASEEDFAALYGSSLASQEMLEERYLDIPEELRKLYLLRRPTDLIRAHRLEKALGTPAHIYLKFEESRPYGTAYMSTLLPQIWYLKKDGYRTLCTGIAPADWACGIAYLACQAGLNCRVYLTEEQKALFPTAIVWLKSLNAELISAEDPDKAIAEACKAGDVAAPARGIRRFSMLHGTVEGLEARTILEELDEYPDMIVGTDNNGLGFSGLAFPFMQEKLAGRLRTQFVLTVPETFPVYHKGLYQWDTEANGLFTSRGYTLGYETYFADGLMRKNASPIHSELVYSGVVEPVTIPITEALDAGMLLARTEGFLPSTVSALALGQTVREAVSCRETETEKVILTSVYGVGDFDLTDYAAKLDGEQFAPEKEMDLKIARAFSDL